MPPPPAAPNAPSEKAIPTATSQPGTKAADPAEPHSQIREALGALRRAKQTRNLEHAAHDFGGHRVEAPQATDEAIHPLQICLNCDKDEGQDFARYRCRIRA